MININKNDLYNNGWIKIPDLILSDDERKFLYKKILETNTNKIYSESTSAHNDFIEMKSIESTFLPVLHKLAIEKGFDIDINDTYYVTRVVNPNEPHEFYKAHFDSHLFTLVTPINIPNTNEEEGNGELVIFPKIRKEPKFEIINIFQKIIYKSFANERGIKYLSKKNKNLIFDFKDNMPVLFLGRTTLHFNLPVENKSGQKRVTLLTHFFDPSSKLGIGPFLRKLRNR